LTIIKKEVGKKGRQGWKRREFLNYEAFADSTRRSLLGGKKEANFKQGGVRKERQVRGHS